MTESDGPKPPCGPFKRGAVKVKNGPAGEKKDGARGLRARRRSRRTGGELAGGVVGPEAKKDGKKRPVRLPGQGKDPKIDRDVQDSDGRSPRQG